MSFANRTSDDRARRRGQLSASRRRPRLPRGPSRATASVTASASRSTAPTATPRTASATRRSSPTTTQARTSGRSPDAYGFCSASPVRSTSREPTRPAARASDKRSNYAFVAARGGVELRDSRGDKIASCGGEGMATERNLKISGYGSYRGSLVAHEDGGRLLVINAVASEDYVRGVVAERVAGVMAGRRAARAGGRRSHLRARDLARRRLRPLLRHPQPGLRRQGFRDQRDQPGRGRHRQAGRHLQGRPRDHLLLLDLGRPDRGLGVRLRRRHRGPVSALGQGSLRRSLTGPQLERDASPTTTWRPS